MSYSYPSPEALDEARRTPSNGFSVAWLLMAAFMVWVQVWVATEFLHAHPVAPGARVHLNGTALGTWAFAMVLHANLSYLANPRQIASSRHGIILVLWNEDPLTLGAIVWHALIVLGVVVAMIAGPTLGHRAAMWSLAMISCVGSAAAGLAAFYLAPLPAFGRAKTAAR